MSKRILVIEDQEDNRTILRDLLTSVGYELIEATNGEEGVKLAEQEKPDLILMDIQLPVIDGYEVTSYALSGDEAKAREAGCDGYVTKPFSPRALLAKVREYLPGENS
jgi:two-component system cell cycle response regulator DivK